MSHRSEETETFGWHQCAERLEGLLAEHELVAGESGKHFVSIEECDGSPAVEFFPPDGCPLTAETLEPEDYLEEIREGLGEHLVVLVQAGAAALGWWTEDEVLHQKVIKAYVVRGRGRAQTLYAKTKGKSRYGSRLRLQNAQKQLVEINEKLGDWWSASGPADRIFYSCPQRTWPELFATRPPPPFEQRDGRLIKIPMHVHVPNLEELERVRRKLLRGRVVYRG